MQTSKAFKLQHGSWCSVLVKGSFQSFPQPCPFSSSVPADQPLFVALCTPTVDRAWSNDSHLCRSFNSVHRLDMTFIRLSDRYVGGGHFRQMMIQKVLLHWLLTNVFMFLFQRFIFFGVFSRRHDRPIVVQSCPS